MALKAEKEALERCRNLYTQVYDRYSGDVFRFACYLVSRREDAEDLYQTVWLRAADNCAKLPAIHDVKAWLFRITANCHRDWLRKQRIRRLLMREYDETTLSQQSMVAPVDVPLSLDLAAAIAQLPPRQKAVFILKEVEGYKLREIAGMLGVHEGTVKSNLHAALGRLRGLINENARGAVARGGIADEV